MRVLILYCHPNPASYTAAVRDLIAQRAAAAGGETRIIDLYGQDFNPVLTHTELQIYENTPENEAAIAPHTDAVRWCDTLVFVYPTWWYGLPAMLKGWLDRVLVPGLAFEMPEGGDIKPGLTHIKRLGVFTTCGASWWLTRFIGFPGRRTILRGIRILCARRCRTAFAAHYLMDASTPETRARHLDRVRRTADKLFSGAR